MDDCVLTLYEWQTFSDESELFDVKAPKNHRANDHYFLLLHDDIIPYDKVLWDKAMEVE